MASWAKDRPSAIAATSGKPFSCQKALSCVHGTVQASHMPRSLAIPSCIKANGFRRMLSSAAAKAFRAVPGQKWHCYFLTKTTGSAPMPIAANWKGCPSCEPRLRKRLHRRCPRRHRLDFRPYCRQPLRPHRPGIHAFPEYRPSPHKPATSQLPLPRRLPPGISPHWTGASDTAARRTLRQTNFARKACATGR